MNEHTMRLKKQKSWKMISKTLEDLFPTIMTTLVIMDSLRGTVDYARKNSRVNLFFICTTQEFI